MSDNDTVTKKDLAEFVTKSYLDDALKRNTKEIVDVLDTYMFQVDQRFNKLEERMDRLEERMDKLVQTVDRFVARIDHYEVEQAARDRQFDRLLAWAKKVSAKTGIPLEDL